jgi:glycerophosphoryl diester phosphodiesterase
MADRTHRIPEIIAHRGASREYHENTLPAFSRALAMGVDGIELDVHATVDGILVVHHDPVVSAGPRGASRPIASMSLVELSNVVLPGDTRVPTLDELCALVGDRATLYVEVKAAGVESLVVEALNRHPTVRMAVHAFDHRIPTRIRDLRPATAIGLLSASYPVDVAGWIGPSHPEAFWQHAALIDEALVAAVHGVGARLIAWTENDPPHARQLAAWGVDGLCSDVPDRIRAALAAEPLAG